MAEKRQYSRICKDLKEFHCPDATLQELKQHFKVEINSLRRFDNISTLEMLILTLQKRDCISEYNIKPLLLIADKVGKEFVSSQPDVNKENLCSEMVQINDVICREIGSKWKDFARELNVAEGDIDEISMRYRTVPERVQEVLRLYKSSYVRRNYQMDLQDALQSAGRTDLSRKITCILCTHNH